jgi:hypothetical protein
MEDDVAAGRPMLAALCVSKMRPGILVCGFFLAAQVLGAFLAIRRARKRVCLPRDSGARCFVKEGNRDPRHRASPAGDHELL